MTYAPVLSDTEHAVLIACLNLSARQVGLKIANEGPNESLVGQLNAVQSLKSKLEASHTTLEAVDQQQEIAR